MPDRSVGRRSGKILQRTVATKRGSTLEEVSKLRPPSQHTTDQCQVPTQASSMSSTGSSHYAMRSRVAETSSSPEPRPCGAHETEVKLKWKEGRWYVEKKTAEPVRVASPDLDESHATRHDSSWLLDTGWVKLRPRGGGLPTGPATTQRREFEPSSLDDVSLCLAGRRLDRVQVDATVADQKDEDHPLLRFQADDSSFFAPARFNRSFGSGIRYLQQNSSGCLEPAEKKEGDVSSPWSAGVCNADLPKESPRGASRSLNSSSNCVGNAYGIKRRKSRPYIVERCRHQLESELAQPRSRAGSALVLSEAEGDILSDPPFACATPPLAFSATCPDFFSKRLGKSLDEDAKTNASASKSKVAETLSPRPLPGGSWGKLHAGKAPPSTAGAASSGSFRATRVPPLPGPFFPESAAAPAWFHNMQNRPQSLSTPYRHGREEFDKWARGTFS
eukprot:gnl/TRDRNA2_/TRDRNA2_29443_c0_seq1.p1 gnl/TRDRNA2_/TRDRNA2_29443_c0~~gnl/TRDRNA2_/TRDRNA2_29443_c0_seq1.p1  ORF type:complete len:446 (+),score=51.19 gnl/TRDRNA2_/TRDRNA2_29443_c0_seq1:130-1467(+)